ncbi:hypothetical protein CAL22_08075 [Bordetella genomosp. 12]|uniref:Uncharacterized protein n=2 Tax=Bordetella genomosp. 12 TaxID=463035 RepID=A0A261VN51_9BORD|nr:hypothetical protein CAL22_08075 [Bordetella genomosp. 12]
MLIGAAVGAYLGAMAGAIFLLRALRLTRLRLAQAEDEAVSRGVVLAAQVHPDEELAVLSLLNDAGGRHIQRQQHLGRAPVGWAARDHTMSQARRTQWQS